MYYTRQLINQSSFRYINPEEGGSPELFYDYINGKIEEKETEKMITGTMVHMALLEPEKFIVAEIPAISDNIKSIVDKVFASAKINDIDLTMLDLKDFEPEITESAKAINFGQSWKPETLVDKVVEGGKEYFNIIKQGQNKIILTTKQKASVDKIVNAIKTQFGHYFEKRDDLDILHELPIFFTVPTNDYTNLDCKAKIDMLIINHSLKEFHIIDLKTISQSIENFPKIFNERRMYRQMAFYERAVREEYKGYSSDIHSIIVAESTGYNRVRQYMISHEYINKGIDEYSDILNRIAFHYSTNNWMISMEDLKNNFIHKLDFDKN